MWPHISLVSGPLRGPGKPRQHPARPGPGHHHVTIRGWESVIIIVSAPGTHDHDDAHLKLMPGFPPGQEVIVVTNFHV